MPRPAAVLLTFDPALNQLDPQDSGKELRQGLSMVLEIGPTLWVANDETLALERLTRQPGPTRTYADHTRFALHELLRLPVPPEDDQAPEADIEGLDYADGYLWLVGSHSLKRRKAEVDKSVVKNQKRLADISADGNRYLLARVPVVLDAAGLPTLVAVAGEGREQRHAARLRGNAKGDELTRALADDPHLGPFLAIAGKDNGFDVEGLAVMPGGHLLLGLRGPVLRGWAVVLEVAPTPDPADPTLLRLQPIGPDGARFRKHFVQLRGLGIRDLLLEGADLLLLAGPTMDLDAPVTVFRWRGGAAPQAESVVFADDQQLTPVLDVPTGRLGRTGTDRAEGICRLTDDPTRLLVVYDAADPARFQGSSSVTADLFRLDQ
ncbi:MAG: DUF3616 domain-containing protein [Microbacteriaceae bacterium]|nr:DUF3616 domain-containing protein [Burkholderiaceae bacterium]